VLQAGLAKVSKLYVVSWIRGSRYRKQQIGRRHVDVDRYWEKSVRMDGTRNLAKRRKMCRLVLTRE
jgi:hypothetical protein